MSSVPYLVHQHELICLKGCPTHTSCMIHSHILEYWWCFTKITSKYFNTGMQNIKSSNRWWYYEISSKVLCYSCRLWFWHQLPKHFLVWHDWYSKFDPPPIKVYNFSLIDEVEFVNVSVSCDMEFVLYSCITESLFLFLPQDLVWNN